MTRAYLCSKQSHGSVVRVQKSTLGQGRAYVMELDAVHVVRNGVLGSMTMENSRKGANGIRGCQCHRKMPVCLVFACASIRTSVDFEV